MEKKEVKITSFQSQNYRLQLVYVIKDLKRSLKKYYEIRENRKKIYSSEYYNKTIEVYARCIVEKLNLKIIAGIPQTITFFKSSNKYFGKYRISTEEAEKYIKSDNYYNIGGFIWERKN